MSIVAESPSGAVETAASPRLPRLAAALAMLGVLEAIGIVALGSRGDARFSIGLDLVTIGFLGTVVAFPVVGALIIARRPRTIVAWVLVLMGVSLGTGVLTAGYGMVGVRPLAGGPPWPFALELLVLSQLFFVPALGLGTTLLLLLYPTDTLLSPRWRWLAAGAVTAAALWDVGVTFRQGELDPIGLPGLLNPLAAPPPLDTVVAVLPIVSNALAVPMILLAMVGLVLRYRRADPVVAAQIRWFALFGAIASVALAVSALNSGPIADVAFGVGVATLPLLPIAIGVAITRYRLYDIDRLINRTLVYGSLTAILAGVFTAGVGLGQRLFIAYTGQSSDIAVVLATLVIATLYAPLRKRLEAVIDRWFKYESRRFGSYTDRVRAVLSIIDPARAAENLARAAVDELDSVGAVVVDGSGAVIGSAGLWPPAPSSDPRLIRVPLADAGPFHAIVLAPRRDGRPYSPAELALLEEAGRLTASAVRPQ
jgi:hypothetical protein